MIANQNELNSLMTNVSDLITPAGFTHYQDPKDGSWFLNPGDDFNYHIFVDQGDYAISQSDRGQQEQRLFTAPCRDGMEMFVTHMLCQSWREEMDLPRLLIVPIPLTPSDVAPGFLLTRQENSWMLTDEASGSRFFANHINLIKFSHYSKLSPEQLRDACLSTDGKPPFFISP